MQEKKIILKELQQIPGVGKVVLDDLYNLKIFKIDDLKNKNADELYDAHNKIKGSIQDRCMLYTFRCAVDYANQTEEQRNGYKLNWWDFKD
jgi:nucleotidyltransferase/DNA polymerase involved in DNA repair